ncbi:MAG: hypothetical protein ABIF40_00340 [archaeon]
MNIIQAYRMGKEDLKLSRDNSFIFDQMLDEPDYTTFERMGVQYSENALKRTEHKAEVEKMGRFKKIVYHLGFIV